MGIEWAIIFFMILLVGVLLLLLQHKQISLDEFKRKSIVIEKESTLVEQKNKILEEQNINLKELNNEKNNVISVVSHDLKAPLNRVFALSNLIYLTSDNLTAEQKNYMDKMNIVVRDGLDLIRNLLDIRAIEFKGVQINIEDVDLMKVITNLTNSYQAYTQKKFQEIKVNAKNDDYVFRSDKQYLNRIFDNLISNAVKFSPLHAELSISIERNEDKMVIEVEDKGPGILPEDQEKLFQKYQVLRAKPTGGESSTGLGLSITKTLVKFLEGEIYHKNVGENKWGSIFVVELPIQTSSPES